MNEKLISVSNNLIFSLLLSSLFCISASETKFELKYRNASIGFTLFIIGLFKKVYIADNLSLIADFGFANSFDLTFFSISFVSVSAIFSAILSDTGMFFFYV